jgi:AGCS family alanine or glycine:cation symporter
MLLRLAALFCLLTLTSFSPALAQEAASPSETVQTAAEQSAPATLAIVELFSHGIEALTGVLESVLFYEVLGFPIVVLWLVIGGTFFTLWLGFPNIRLFRHALKVVSGKYSKPEDPGEITHFQALSAAVSGTVGLGNIAGVAIAVTAGGPGAVVWMMIAGFVGMSTKFAEVSLGHKYRKIDANGRVSGGAFYYLRDGLAELGWPRFGKILSVIFALFALAGSFGGGNMFQSSQSVKMFTETFSGMGDMDWAIALVMAIAVGTVLIGGIKRIATTAEAIVPVMAVVYMTAAITVLIVNAAHIPEAISVMFTQAFTPEALGGGMLGAIIMGFRRAAFSNEAGIGSAPIAHAPGKTTEPVRAGVVALLEPFIDTIVICFTTGLVITVSGVYADPTIEGAGSWRGVLLTSAAFGTVIDWFPVVLSICVIMFAFSTMITWSYYGERAWQYLFGAKSVRLYYVLFCSATFFGGATEKVKMIVNLSDLLLLAMAIPNLIGLYILAPGLRRMVGSYVRRLNAGEFVEVKKEDKAA